MRKNIFLHSILAALTAVSITLASGDIPSSKHPAGKAAAAQSDDSFTLGNNLLSASFQWKDGGVQFGGLMEQKDKGLAAICETAGQLTYVYAMASGNGAIAAPTTAHGNSNFIYKHRKPPEKNGQLTIDN